MKSSVGRCARAVISAAALLFGSSIALRAQYDLVVTNIGNTVGVDAGAWVVFTATIENRGNAPTPAGVIHGVSFWVDGRPVSWSDNWAGSLAPGDSVVVQANGGPDTGWDGIWRWTNAGVHDVFAWVDDINRMPGEADENNNIFGTTMTILGDIVQSVEVVAPTGLRAGEGVYFVAMAEQHNGDPTVHTVGTTVSFYLDGNFLYSSTQSYPQQPDATVFVDSRYEFQFAGNPGIPTPGRLWVATTGTHTIEAIIGGPLPSRVVQTFVVEEAPAADLVVDAVFADTPPGEAGEEVLFHATIRNAGSGATQAGVIHGVSFWIDGQAMSWSDTFVDSLAPGASVTLTANWGPFGKATWTAQSGVHTLAAWVDDIDRMPDEADENNNITETTLSVP
jgi:hypothetical protein